MPSQQIGQGKYAFRAGFLSGDEAVSLRFDMENDEAAIEQGARLFKTTYTSRELARKELPIIGVLFRGTERLACFRFVNDEFVTEPAEPTLIKAARIRYDDARVFGMPATAANLAALFILAVCVFIGFRDGGAGIITFTSLCYVVWISARAANIIFGRKKYVDTLVWDFFSNRDKGTYRHFALYIHKPRLAYFFSTTLHWLRIAAVGFIAFALWHEHYIESALLGLFVLLSGGAIASLYPDLYFEDAAEGGNRGAADMLQTLRHIQEMMKP